MNRDALVTGCAGKDQLSRDIFTKAKRRYRGMIDGAVSRAGGRGFDNSPPIRFPSCHLNKKAQEKKYMKKKLDHENTVMLQRLRATGSGLDRKPTDLPHEARAFAKMRTKYWQVKNMQKRNAKILRGIKKQSSYYQPRSEHEKKSYKRYRRLFSRVNQSSPAPGLSSAPSTSPFTESIRGLPGYRSTSSSGIILRQRQNRRSPHSSIRSSTSRGKFPFSSFSSGNSSTNKEATTETLYLNNIPGQEQFDSLLKNKIKSKYNTPNTNQGKMKTSLLNESLKFNQFMSMRGPSMFKTSPAAGHSWSKRRKRPVTSFNNSSLQKEIYNINLDMENAEIRPSTALNGYQKHENIFDNSSSEHTSDTNDTFIVKDNVKHVSEVIQDSNIDGNVILFKETLHLPGLKTTSNSNTGKTSSFSSQAVHVKTSNNSSSNISCVQEQILYPINVEVNVSRADKSVVLIHVTTTAHNNIRTPNKKHNKTYFHSVLSKTNATGIKALVEVLLVGSAFLSTHSDTTIKSASVIANKHAYLHENILSDDSNYIETSKNIGEISLDSVKSKYANVLLDASTIPLIDGIIQGKDTHYSLDVNVPNESAIISAIRIGIIIIQKYCSLLGHSVSSTGGDGAIKIQQWTSVHDKLSLASTLLEAYYSAYLDLKAVSKNKTPETSVVYSSSGCSLTLKYQVRDFCYFLPADSCTSKVSQLVKHIDSLCLSSTTQQVREQKNNSAAPIWKSLLQNLVVIQKHEKKNKEGYSQPRIHSLGALHQLQIDPSLDENTDLINSQTSGLALALHSTLRTGAGEHFVSDDGKIAHSRLRCSTPYRSGGSLEYICYCGCVNNHVFIGLYELVSSSGPTRIGASCVFEDDIIIDKFSLKNKKIEKAMIKTGGWLRLKGNYNALEAAAEAMVQSIVPVIQVRN